MKKISTATLASVAVGSGLSIIAIALTARFLGDRWDDIAASPGTGIGLSIARRLARLHGGDLRLLPSGPGARFELRIRTPRCDGEVQP